MTQSPFVLYWDTSAVLSALFKDDHSDVAVAYGRSDGVHLLSSLAWAETLAVIARIEREHMLADILIAAAREALEQGPWRHVNVVPNWNETQMLAKAWPLRGTDLWHLATAKSLRSELPELTLLSFDAKLVAAAEGEGFAQRTSRDTPQ